MEAVYAKASALEVLPEKMRLVSNSTGASSGVITILSDTFLGTPQYKIGGSRALGGRSLRNLPVSGKRLRQMKRKKIGIPGGNSKS